MKTENSFYTLLDIGAIVIYSFIYLKEFDYSTQSALFLNFHILSEYRILTSKHF
jgi:hypothetical protein